MEFEVNNISRPGEVVAFFFLLHARNPGILRESFTGSFPQAVERNVTSTSHSTLCEKLRMICMLCF